MKYDIFKILQKHNPNPWDLGDSAEGAIHLSLCTGYDGIGLGLELAGVEIGFTIYVEIEAYAQANLVEKINYGWMAPGVLFPDVKTFHYRKFRGLIDILSGGFPCQPFSSEGFRQGDEDPRHLFPYFLQGIKDCLPSIVLLENVKGICSAKISKDTGSFKAGTSVLQYVLGELEQVGYTATAVPVTAAEAGAPHSRFRWFIVAVLNSEGERLRRDALDRQEPTEQGNDKAFIGNANRGVIARGLRKYIFPNKKSSVQKHEEQPRVVETNAINIVEPIDRYRQVSDKYKVCRTDYGYPYRMDYDKLPTSAYSPEDEMRLLGNGVCPQAAAIAFKLGMKECLSRRT